MAARPDVADLTRALVRLPSVTPECGPALDLLGNILEELGFRCHRLTFAEDGTAPVDNLFARLGEGRPHFCFAGHVDVVPVGDAARWTVDPFAGEIVDGRLFGRGASDMKGAIAAFVTAAAEALEGGGPRPGSISLLITGDEEGPAINGTVKLLEWMAGEGHIPNACLVGEPTNPHRLGEMMKIGRRGSLNCRLTVFGAQGHVAYPGLADNPVTRAIAMLGRVSEAELDQGTEYFHASRLEVTSVDVGNPSHNVIPARAEARFNIRFNDRHTPDSLVDWLHRRFSQIGGGYELDARATGDAFVSPPSPLIEMISNAVEEVTGLVPERSTSGGTSDARYIKDYCPVAEFGLTGESMHKVDEWVALADLDALTRIYRGVLARAAGGF